MQPGLLRARECAQAGDCKRAILVNERYNVGDRRKRDEVEMPLRDLGGDTEERLAELVDDTGAAELRERIVGRTRRDDRAVGERLAWPVVVGDDHLEPARARLRNLGNGRDPTVDREHKPAALVCEAAERGARDAVALVEAARQVPVDLGAELPEQEGVVGRSCAVEERARVLGVGVPAPDKNACRQLADPELPGKLGLQPVRARTDCPGALVHGSITVGMRSDDILDGARELFLLDPDVVFLNHGSYGACPKPVFERYQAWQRELEREPVDFISRRLPELLDHARAELGAFVGADGDDLTFVPNATTGVNMAARARPAARG